jgi:superfamily I DNA/RNA helicase
LVTFNRALVTYLKHLASKELRNVTVEHYHKFVRGYLNSRGQMDDNVIVGPEERFALIKDSINPIRANNATHPLFSKTPEFIAEELKWISQHGIETSDQYLAHPPQLPSDLDSETTLPLLWETLKGYHVLRAQAGRRYDWDDVAMTARNELAQDDRKRLYKHIIIDEGQDFSPVMLQSLVRAIPRDGSITFFGDVAQQIYGSRISWRSAGFDLKTDPWLFQENYRNTKQIADLALALTKMPFYQGAADLVSPRSPKAAGPPPSLLVFSKLKQETDFVTDQAVKLSQAGSVAILTANHEDRKYFNSFFNSGTYTELKNDMTRWKSGAGLSIGTYHAAKGLEFDSVILPRLGADQVPPLEEVNSFGEEQARADAGRLLYVGITRARQGLILTSTGSPTELLPNDRNILPLVTP